MTSRRRTAAAIGLALFALAGAALPALLAPAAWAEVPVLADRWSGPGSVRPPFKKLLVVGITRNAPARRRYEDLFVSQIRGRELQGITSYPIVPDLEHPADRDKVLETLLAGGVDGVITARLVSLDDRDEKEWAEAWRREVEAVVPIRAYVQDSLNSLPPEGSLYGVEFALWGVDSGQRLWAGRSHPVKIKKIRKDANLLVQDVMTQLIFENRL
ncbi:MAG TPA: hypothetical protein VGS03_09390 [Candidatus Polarisedimenticolia bacterium]|jgi:hypothetical protein|nr:hypothetical protein [Candidatus Polarisedimenticolia bacterium]